MKIDRRRDVAAHQRARVILQDHSTGVLNLVSPALRSRLINASVAAVPVGRTHQAPNYVSDLGVRQSPEPSTFAAQTCIALGSDASTQPVLDAQATAAAYAAEHLSESDMAGAIDATVNMWGQWEAAAATALATWHGPRTVTTHRLWLYIGCVLAATGHPRAGQALQAAAQAADTRPADAYMTRIRRAAWLIKRRDEPQEASAVLDSMISDLKRPVDACLGDDDAFVLAGVALNLRALVEVKSGDLVGARSRIERARSNLRANELVCVGEDERRRYKSQVEINFIQLLCQSDALAQADDLARAHVEWAQQFHLPSTAEALANAGYVAYLISDYARALDYLRTAEVLLTNEGAVERLKMTRKIMVGCLHRSGRTDNAARVAHLAATDPLGQQSASSPPTQKAT